jgi:hypothetical protein
MGNYLEELNKYIIDDNIDLLRKKLSNKNINIKKEDFNELLMLSCEKNKKEIIELFYKDDRFDFSYQEILKCGFVQSAFREACRNCSYEIVDLFFKKNVDIFLGKESFLTCVANNNDSRVIEKILQVSRDKKIDLNYNYVLLDQASTPYLGSIKALFNDNRVNPNIDKNDFLLTLVLLYDGYIIEREPEILEFILNDTRFSFIPYDLQDFKNAYKKIKKDKYILYKLFYSIPELQEDLLFYLQDSLGYFPENIEYLEAIKTMQKINDF